MTTRQEGQVALYDDAEDMSNANEINVTTLSSNIITDLDGETATEYSKETATQRDLTQLQEHYKQLQEKLNQLGKAINTPAHHEELAHLTGKHRNWP